MKIHKIIAVLVLSVLMLASCKPEAEPDRLEPAESVVFDASALTNREIPVQAATDIKITNMDPERMYAVRRTNGPGSRAAAAEYTGSDSIVMIGDSCIPVPDKNNTSEFKASDAGIRDNGYISVVELKTSSTNDFVVLENEDYFSYMTDTQIPVYEQYWHLDTDRFRELGITDPSKVIIGVNRWGSGAGSTNWGYVTIDNGYVSKSFESAFYDFTGLDFINFYCAMAVTESNSPWGTQVIICNALDLADGPAVPRNTMEWFNIPKDTTGRKYVIECDTPLDHLQLTDDFNLKTYDGLNLPTMVRLQNTGTKTVLYVGEVKEDLILELQFWNELNFGEIPENGASVMLREATAAEVACYENEHVLKVGEGTTELTLKGYDGTRDISFVNASGGPLYNRTLEVQMRNEDGSWYQEEWSSVSMKTLHNSGYGYSSYSSEGPYIKTVFDSYEAVDMLRIHALPENVDITVRVMPSPENVQYENHIYILHGNELSEIEDIAYTDWKYSYTVPSFTRPEAELRKVLVNGQYMKPGSETVLYGISTCIMPIWLDYTKLPPALTTEPKDIMEPETQHVLKKEAAGKNFVLEMTGNIRKIYVNRLVLKDFHDTRLSDPVLIEQTNDRYLYYIGEIPVNMLLDAKFGAYNGESYTAGDIRMSLREATETEQQDFTDNHLIVLSDQKFTREFTDPDEWKRMFRVIGGDASAERSWNLIYEATDTDGNYIADEYTQILTGQMSKWKNIYYSVGTGPYSDITFLNSESPDTISIEGPTGTKHRITITPIEPVEEEIYSYTVIMNGKPETFKRTESTGKYTIPSEYGETAVSGAWNGAELLKPGQEIDLEWKTSTCFVLLTEKDMPPRLVLGTPLPVPLGDQRITVEVEDTTKPYILELTRNSGKNYWANYFVYDTAAGKACPAMRISLTKTKSVYYLESLPASGELYFYGEDATDTLLLREPNEAEKSLYSKMVINQPIASFKIEDNMLDKDYDRFSVSFKVDPALSEMRHINAVSPDMPEECIIELQTALIDKHGNMISPGYPTVSGKTKMEIDIPEGHKLHHIVVTIFHPKPCTLNIEFSKSGK